MLKKLASISQVLKASKKNEIFVEFLIILIRKCNKNFGFLRDMNCYLLYVPFSVPTY